MAHKIIFNFSDAPTYAKILPIVGLAAGVGLAIYQKKDCIGCFLGYGFSGLLIGGMPLLYKMKQLGNLNDVEIKPTIEN